MLFTDELAVYKGIGSRYRGHKRIRHRANVYVDGDTHTQTVEGFFGLFKNGVRGVYHELYPDVVDACEEVGGVPSRLIKTDRREAGKEGTPCRMFAGSPSGSRLRVRSRSMTWLVRALAG
jgi:hypothetical protein